MKDKLPTYSKNQQTGNISAAILKSIMEKFCIFTDIEQSQDLGIDFIGTVIENHHPTEYNFNVQCKGTDDSEIKLNADKTMFSYEINVSTINYWKQKRDVTFLFLVDIKNYQIYWTAPLREIENKDLSEQDKKTFHIHKTNCINLNSTKLPETFIFEIIRYYANFSAPIIKQFDKIQNYASVSDDLGHMFELIEILEKNYNKVGEKYKETIDKLINKIKFDLDRIGYYCSQLVYMNDVVRKYCPKGIYNTPFYTGKKSITFDECRENVESIISREDITYKELFELSKEVTKLRCNFLGFYREMLYEDSPFGDFDAIDKEFFEVS